ncbi:unnamed protein product [Nesidiocoris tenuis]|uniref:Uncharacterized protein n=1 Tax=Nesidiocoris tenuis TaxID=355587 RepID=A0A6H5GDY5_9HEMI|nr:unnamed protein product [Nesidiocoris tenuis]
MPGRAVHAPRMLRRLGANGARLPEKLRPGPLMVRAAAAPEPLDQERIRPGVQGLRLPVRAGPLEKGPRLVPAAARLRGPRRRRRRHQEEEKEEQTGRRHRDGRHAGPPRQRTQERPDCRRADRRSPRQDRIALIVDDQFLLFAARLGLVHLARPLVVRCRPETQDENRILHRQPTISSGAFVRIAFSAFLSIRGSGTMHSEKRFSARNDMKISANRIRVPPSIEMSFTPCKGDSSVICPSTNQRGLRIFPSLCSKSFDLFPSAWLTRPSMVFRSRTCYSALTANFGKSEKSTSEKTSPRCTPQGYKYTHSGCNPRNRSKIRMSSTGWLLVPDPTAKCHQWKRHILKKTGLQHPRTVSRTSLGLAGDSPDDELSFTENHDCWIAQVVSERAEISFCYRQGLPCTGKTALSILLRRLAYPNRLAIWSGSSDDHNTSIYSVNMEAPSQKTGPCPSMGEPFLYFPSCQPWGGIVCISGSIPNIGISAVRIQLSIPNDRLTKFGCFQSLLSRQGQHCCA